MLSSEVIRMDENYMALFLQTGNPVFYTAAKSGELPEGHTGEKTPPQSEG